MFGSDYFRGALSVNSHITVETAIMATISTRGMITGRQVLDDGTTILLLDAMNRLKKIRWTPGEGELGW